METTILFVGLFFPIISWVSLIITQLLLKYKNKYSSAILTPLIGPILLNIWMYMTDKAIWMYPIPWVLDIGTLPFLIMLPKQIKDEWSLSSYTQIFSISSTVGLQSTKISFHKSGKYLIKFRWKRIEKDFGIIATNDFGKFNKLRDGNYVLTSHTGNIITLKKEDNSYHCIDSSKDNNINLDGWILN